MTKGSAQNPPPDAGIDAFEFWTPERRPLARNPAVQFDPPLACYATHQAVNGFGRPTSQVNAWVADQADPRPALTLAWSEPKDIAVVDVVLDTDADHPMESVLMQHSERITPFCARNLRLKLPDGRILAEVRDNHQTRVSLRIDPPVRTRSLTLEVDHPSATEPACVVEVKCYER